MAQRTWPGKVKFHVKSCLLTNPTTTQIGSGWISMTGSNRLSYFIDVIVITVVIIRYQSDYLSHVKSFLLTTVSDCPPVIDSPPPQLPESGMGLTFKKLPPYQSVRGYCYWACS